MKGLACQPQVKRLAHITCALLWESESDSQMHSSGCKSWIWSIASSCFSWFALQKCEFGLWAMGMLEHSFLTEFRRNIRVPLPKWMSTCFKDSISLFCVAHCMMCSVLVALLVIPSSALPKPGAEDEWWARAAENLNLLFSPLRCLFCAYFLNEGGSRSSAGRWTVASAPCWSHAWASLSWPWGQASPDK